MNCVHMGPIQLETGIAHLLQPLVSQGSTLLQEHYPYRLTLRGNIQGVFGVRENTLRHDARRKLDWAGERWTGFARGSAETQQREPGDQDDQHQADRGVGE